ncbi:MAG: hypothetical protein GY934_05715, partial [Gammaproteobacteria bacterium]|nr:hypothetical protein [Gammaproteobacteria bacterium]
GGGSFFEAESSAGLVDVFQTILTDVLSRSTSFTAAAVSVNQFENLSHDDDIYFSTFEPSGTRRWIGNLKKYKICQGAAGDTCTVGDIIDEDGESALTTDNYFAETAKDFWSRTSATDDGNQVDAGGVGGRGGLARKIYTNRDGGTAGVSLNTAENRIEEADITTMDTTLSSLLSPGSDQEYLDVV